MFRKTLAIAILALAATLGCGQSPAGIYFCPMHPEVEQGQPGKCPKCGMDLTLKEAAS
ncbi:MAG: hypothetical protein HYS13_05195 [Planctomycetia bacterium]|nr:hypothetical protein [Planctomycetia bacterium]